MRDKMLDYNDATAAQIVCEVNSCYNETVIWEKLLISSLVL